MNHIYYDNTIALISKFDQILKQNTEDFCQYFDREDEETKDLIAFRSNQNFQNFDTSQTYLLKDDTILHFAARVFAKATELERYNLLVKITYLICFVGLKYFQEGGLQLLNHKNTTDHNFIATINLYNSKDALLISYIFSRELSKQIKSWEENNTNYFVTMANYPVLSKINYLKSIINENTSVVNEQNSLQSSKPNTIRLIKPKLLPKPIQPQIQSNLFGTKRAREETSSKHSSNKIARFQPESKNSHQNDQPLIIIEEIEDLTIPYQTPSIQSPQTPLEVDHYVDSQIKEHLEKFDQQDSMASESYIDIIVDGFLKELESKDQTGNPENILIVDETIEVID